MLRMYISFLYFHQLKSTFEVDEMMQIKDQFVFTKLIHFLLMNVTESEGGRRRGWNPSIFMFSPQTAQRKVQCVLYIYLFNPKVKGHLFMSPFQAHKKWDDWVKQGCRILLLCDGLQVIPTELFKGEGAEGRERTIYNNCWKKLLWLKHCYTYIHITWL